MQTYYSRTCVFIFILVSTSIGCSSACPPGCNCRGSPEKRDTAVCYKSWPYTHKPVEFNEPITSIEFRQLLFQDMEPYLEAVHDVTNVIIYPPMKSSDDNPVPDDLFKNVENLKALTIHPTLDRLAPAGLGKAIQPLTNLKTLDFVGNTIHCDCTLPKTIASQNILLLSKSRMPAVKECKRHGFPTDLYNIHDFLEKCAERGGYELDEPSNDIVPQVQAGLSNRRFGNIRDQKLFKAGIKHTRINSNPMKPSAAKRVPGAFSGALGKPRSRNLRLREPGAKRVLLPGGLSAFARKKPTFSANKFASRYSKARRWGRRRLLSLDEVDIDPAFSEVIATAQGEEKRQKRRATTLNKTRRRKFMKKYFGNFLNAYKKRGRGGRRQKNKNRRGRRRLLSLDEVDIDPAFSEVVTAQHEEKRQKRQATTRKKKRRRRPVKILPGMSMEDFINAHKKRGRGRRRRKNKNGWTRLSGGWRYREIRSVGGENNSDSYFPLELPVPPNGQSQQKSEEDSQEVSLGSKRSRWGRRRLLSLDEVDIDPAFSEVIATAQGEEKRQKRQATTRKKKRRRRPVKILPGMSMEDFINAHKKRGRGRRRRKNKNGWTRLSGGWRYREIRSVGGENNSDSYFPLELPVPPNGQSQQKSEEDSQEVSLESKRSRWGRRRLLSLDDVDIDPAFSEVIATAQGEEKRQKRQATTRKKKRRRRPVKILPGMSMEDFINAHKKRGRGRRRRKNKNGWTRLSGGWRYREIRSVGGENNSDSYFPLELPVPPNGQSQQKSEEDSQEVSLRSKRNIVRNDLISMLGRLRQRKGAQRFQKQNLWADQYLSGQRRRGERSANGQNDNNILEDVLSISNRTGYPLRGDTSNQSPTDDAEQQNVNRNMEESRGKPTDAVQLGRPVPPPVYANPRRRPHAHPPGQGHDHHRRHLQGKIARQLAINQLPINDLTVKLNPFDPFEVDLFFQYILHNENLPSIGSYRTLNDENKL